MHSNNQPQVLFKPVPPQETVKNKTSEDLETERILLASKPLQHSLDFIPKCTKVTEVYLCGPFHTQGQLNKQEEQCIVTVK